MNEGDLTDEVVSAIESLASSTPFPSLLHLHLRGSPDSITTLLSPFAASPILQVELVVCLDPSTSPLAVSQPLETALEVTRGTLRALSLELESEDNSARWTSTTAMGLQHLAAESGFLLSISPLFVLLVNTLSPSADPSWPPEEARRRLTAERCDALDEVLEFAQSLSARARLTDDVETADALIASMEGLVALKLREQD